MPQTAPTLRIVARPGHPDFLDLPWREPLADWQVPRIVEVARGLHRHVVRFVDYGGALYALKELPGDLAEREYRLLRRMADESLPAVQAVAVARRSGLDDVLVTRHLDFSLPYRNVFLHRRGLLADVEALSSRLLDALVNLLVRLHMAGFWWGDCSLSNALFRRDAGALAAYLVDAETGEWHPRLTDGQREADLDTTLQNVAGGLFDVQAELGLDDGPDPVEVAFDLRRRYDRLWAEVTSTQGVGSVDRHDVESRIRRLNELGFDVHEIEVSQGPEGSELVLRPAVVESGYHQRALFGLTGLQAQENQARSLLNDLANHRAHLERAQGRSLPESVAAHRWLSEVFEPTVAAIPEDLRTKLEPAEVFHEVIEHKYLLSEARGHDVGLPAAVDSYMSHVLPDVPEERTVILDEPGEGWIGFG